MSYEITASWETLMRQAGMTSDNYFEHALSTLEASGLGFTAADVIALAAISERDFKNSSQFISNQKMCDSFDNLSSSIISLVDTLELIREANQ